MKQLIEIKAIAGELRVDSRIIGRECGVQHENVIELLEAHAALMESHFGVFRFETGKPNAGSKGGRPVRFSLLTEDQATFLITLMRNTEPVLRFKAALVKAFRDARQSLQSVLSADEEADIATMIKALQGAFQARLDGKIDNGTAIALAQVASQYTRLWDVRLRMRAPGSMPALPKLRGKLIEE